MKINIPDKKDFIQNYIAPISTLNTVCCIDVKSNIARTICSTASNTICLIADTPISSDEERSLNIPDIRRLSGIFSVLKKKDINLSVNTNNIKYDDGEYKFSYHLLEDGMIKKTTINLDKVRSLNWDTTFSVDEQSLDILFKGTSFASGTNKVYFYTENNALMAELGDKTKHNVDSFITTLSPTFEGKEIVKPLPISLDTFRLISYNNATKIQFQINTQYGMLRLNVIKGAADLTYIMSALIN